MAPDFDYKAIGENIRKRRKAKPLTQAELAKKIGKTESSISKYEKGSVEIPLKVLEKIAKELNVSVADLTLSFLYNNSLFSTLNPTKSTFLDYLSSIGIKPMGVYETNNDPDSPKVVKFTIRQNASPYRTTESVAILTVSNLEKIEEEIFRFSHSIVNLLSQELDSKEFIRFKPCENEADWFGKE